MSALFKGTGGYVIVADEPQFDSQTGAKWFDRTWAGSVGAINGLTVELEAQGISYRTSQSGPVVTLTARVPWIEPEEVPPDRYEITTTAQDKSIFEHPLVVEDAYNYDGGLTADRDTYREKCEKAVSSYVDFLIFNSGNSSNPAAANARFARVVRHLRGGTTGWQVDFITLRRFRQVSIEYASGAGKFNLTDSQYIYTTAQLGLPASVAFSLPSAPDAPYPADVQDYQWGWRRIGQRVDIVGNFAEQNVELTFAPWSNLLYTPSSIALNW